MTQRRSFIRAAEMALNALHQRLFDQAGRFVTHRVLVVMLAGQRRHSRGHQLLLLLLKLLLLLLLLMMVQLLRLLLLRMLDGRLGSSVAQAAVEFPPGIQRLVRPDPKAGRDAHNQRHEIPKIIEKQREEEACN